MSESMDFARFRPRVAVLLTSGALALAALVAGGCTSPDSDERGRFATVQGAVVDATDGTPIAGAEVTVVPQIFPVPADPNAPLGTRNYTGPFGPFVTDQNGVFTIPSVPVTSDRNNPVVLNLRASAGGFLPALVAQPAPETTSFLGRAFIAGVPTTDIVITGETVTGLSAKLTRATGANTSVLAVSPATISTASVTPTGIGTTFNVTIPQNAVSAPTTVTVAGVTGSSLAGVAAMPPSNVPAAGASSAPAGAVLPGASARATVAVGGLSVSVPQGVTFLQPVQVVVPVPGFALGIASSLRVVRYDETTGTWKLVTSTLNPAGTELSFSFTQPGTYAVVLGATWTIGDVVAAAPGEGPAAANAPANETSVILPPLADFPNGYVVSGRLLEQITFGTSNDLAQILAESYEALTGASTSLSPSALVEVVPPAPAGLNCSKVKFPITIDIDGDGRIEGTRFTWTCAGFTAASSQSTVPPHLQGHIQGGAVGF